MDQHVLLLQRDFQGLLLRSCAIAYFADGDTLNSFSKVPLRILQPLVISDHVRVISAQSSFQTRYFQAYSDTPSRTHEYGCNAPQSAITSLFSFYHSRARVDESLGMGFDQLHWDNVLLG